MNERIRLIREETGLSMKKFGERIGISDGAVAKLEKPNGNKASEQTIRAICQEFNVSRTWLVDGIEPMHNPNDEFDVLIRQIWPDATPRVIEFLRNVSNVPGGLDRLIDALDSLTLFANKKPEA